ncbi:MAG TPA: hypothetical protein VK894_13135 [Jiangellales bacterium]|nr:hypothetical protein [Jiangellales bacterium]
MASRSRWNRGGRAGHDVPHPLAFQLSIAVTVFGFGLGARNEDILYVFRRPRLLVVTLLAMFVVVPVIALALELYLDLPHPARVALVALALSPIPQLLPRTAIESATGICRRPCRTGAAGRPARRRRPSPTTPPTSLSTSATG